MIEVCNSLIAPLGQSYISGKLIDVGIIGEWLEIASQLFDGDLEAKVIVYRNYAFNARIHRKCHAMVAIINRRKRRYPEYF